MIILPVSGVAGRTDVLCHVSLKTYPPPRKFMRNNLRDPEFHILIQHSHLGIKIRPTIRSIRNDAGCHTPDWMPMTACGYVWSPVRDTNMIVARTNLRKNIVFHLENPEYSTPLSAIAMAFFSSFLLLR